MSRMCAGDSASVAAAFHLGVRAGRSSVHTPWCVCARARVRVSCSIVYTLQYRGVAGTGYKSAAGDLSTWIFSSSSSVPNDLQKLLGCLVYSHIARRLVDLPSPVGRTPGAIGRSREITSCS